MLLMWRLTGFTNIPLGILAPVSVFVECGFCFYFASKHNIHSAMIYLHAINQLFTGICIAIYGIESRVDTRTNCACYGNTTRVLLIAVKTIPSISSKYDIIEVEEDKQQKYKIFLTPTFSTPHTDYSYDPTIEPSTVPN